MAGVEVTSNAGDDDTYALGETITITVTFSEAVDVTGTPQLKIDMDPAEWGEKVVDYAGGSGTTAVTFDHEVVEPNYSSRGIAVLANSLALNGGTIRSASSQTAAALAHDGLAHDSEHKVDWQRTRPAPSVTGVEVTSNAGDDDTYVLGETITVTVTFSEAVDVTGTPRLKIDMDPAEWGEKVLDYESGSGTAVLTFEHTVVQPNYSSVGIAVLADSLALNGGTISSASSRTAAALAHDGLAHDSGHKVDWQRTRPNRAPVVDTDAENYAQITGDINAPSEVLVSKPFYQVFSDPDGDELTYAVSVTSGNSHLVGELDIGLDYRTPENSHRPPEIFHRVWFKAADDAGWKAVTPALADPAPVTVRLTATDPGGLSVWVDGDFLVHWESQPELQSATITGQSIELTFDIAVEDDPAPAAGQFTVNVANEDGTSGTIAVSGVSVDGAVVTLALASAPQPGQTVTLDYANDYDTPLQRAGGGDPAPDFTGQAVTPPTLDLRLVPANAGASSRLITASWNALRGATSQNLRWRRSGDDSRQWNTRELPGDRTSADIEVEASGLHDVDLEVYGSDGFIIAESNQVDVRVTSRLNAVTSLVRDPRARGCEARTIDGFEVVFTNSGIELSWDDPGIAAITGYRIQLSDDGGLYLSPSRASSWSDIAGSHAGTTSHTLTGLVMNHTYGVWIHAVAPGDRYYCMARYAFITPFDVLIPAVTGLKAYNSWDEGPEQAALSWDDHGRQGLSYEYQFEGVPPSWADSGSVRGLYRVRTGVLSPDQVWVGRDGKLQATIGGLPCDYSYFRIWLRAKDGASYGPRMVLNYVYLGRDHGSPQGSEHTADYDHRGNCLYGWGGDDRLYGGDADDILSGGTGNDVLEGRGGNDWLHGGPGADTLDGGPGIDTASYSGSRGAVTVNLAARSASGGDADGDTIVGIENLVGSDRADTLTGNAGDNVLEGGRGADRLVGGGGKDTASYARSRAAVTVNLQATATCTTYSGATVAAGVRSGGDAAGDTLTGIENLTGSDHADVLCGDGEDNVITGGGGVRVVSGAHIGDSIDCGGGSDTLDYSDSPEGVSTSIVSQFGFGGDAEGDFFVACENVIGSNHDDIIGGDSDENVLRGEGGNDILSGSRGNDTLYGGAGADMLTGDHENDVLFGGSGNDTLIGGRGNDRLTGGPGDDTLRGPSPVDGLADTDGDEFFFHARFGRDTVHHFQIASDTIYLCGMEGVDWTGWPGSDYYYISVWAYDDLPYVGRVKWFHGSITLEGVNLPWSRNDPPGGLKLVVPANLGVTCETLASRPNVQSASVNRSVLTLTFDQHLDSGSIPAKGAFSVTVGGSAQAPTQVAISGNTVTLTLSSAVTAGEVVMVSYAPPASNRLRGSVSGNEVSGFTGLLVLNETSADPNSPENLRVETDNNSGAYVAWDAPASLATGRTLSGYVVEWKAGTTATATVSADTTSHRITGLTDGTTYTVRVAARTTGTSPTSLDSWGPAAPPITAWSEPTQVWFSDNTPVIRSGVLAIQTATNKTGVSIVCTVLITGPPSPESCPPGTRIQVQRAGGIDSRVDIRAIATLDGESVSTVTGGHPDGPSGFASSASAGADSSDNDPATHEGKIVVAWEAASTAGITGGIRYYVAHRTDTSANFSDWIRKTASDRSHTFTGLADETYEVIVLATAVTTGDHDGDPSTPHQEIETDGFHSEIHTVTVAAGNTAVPGGPTGGSVTPGSGTLTVEWEPPSVAGSPVHAYAYQVRHRLNGATAWTESAMLYPRQTLRICGNEGCDNPRSYEIADLTENSAYEVEVRAHNANGASSWVTIGGVGATHRALPPTPA